MNSTALGAGAEKAQEIIFISEAYECIFRSIGNLIPLETG